MDSPLVGVVLSAENELPYMEECERILIGFGIPYEIRVLSVQSHIEHCLMWARSAQERGLHAIVVGAGNVSPLANVIASQTLLPVIAVPLPTHSLQGLDALLSVAQTTVGTPFATMSVGSAGAANAGIFATQILALKFPEHLNQSLVSYKTSLSQQIEAKDQALYQDRMQKMQSS